jgi:hypothetical protein
MFVKEGFVFFAAFDPADGCHHTKKASFQCDLIASRVLQNAALAQRQEF